MSQFRFEEFNPRRHMRGAEAARVTWVNDQGEDGSEAMDSDQEQIVRQKR